MQIPTCCACQIQNISPFTGNKKLSFKPDTGIQKNVIAEEPSVSQMAVTKPEMRNQVIILVAIACYLQYFSCSFFTLYNLFHVTLVRHHMVFDQRTRSNFKILIVALAIGLNPVTLTLRVTEQTIVNSNHSRSVCRSQN